MSVGHRLAALRPRLAETEIDTLMVSSPENRQYLSGFSGSHGYLMITDSAAVLATDFRYLEQAKEESPDFVVQQIRGGETWLPAILSELGARVLGIEASHLTVAAHRALQADLEDASDVVIEETTGLVEEIRAVKDADELSLITHAVEIADEAMGVVGPAILPGMTERQIAWQIEVEMRRLGAEGPAFDIIVGAGANGALPHHRAGSTEVRPGDPVVIDMGANYRGYRSDLTRTWPVGGADKTFSSIYDIVLRAQQTAIAEARPGMTGKELDSVARSVIANAGYGDEFGHGLGHGVGLVIHEKPMVVPSSDDVIHDGMVFTIEPGIYISGWGGIRIEDVVVLEEGRARVLTRSPK